MGDKERTRAAEDAFVRQTVAAIDAREKGGSMDVRIVIPIPSDKILANMKNATALLGNPTAGAILRVMRETDRGLN